MKKTRWLLLVLLLALGVSGGALASGERFDSFADYGRAVAGLMGAQAKGMGEDAVQARLLIRTKKALDLSAYAPVAVVEGPGHRYTVQFGSVAEAEACREALAGDRNTVYAQPDALVTLDGEPTLVEPDEPVRPGKNKAVARAYAGNSWGVEAMGAAGLASSITASGSVTVAVVDSGVGAHLLLDPRVKAGGLDFVDPANKDGRDDGRGHGTHVAGTIVDMTPGLKVHILPVRVLNDEGRGYLSAAANGILYAAEAGAKVINLSLGGALLSPNEPTPLSDAIDYATQKGVTVVAAAGNNNGDTKYIAPAGLTAPIVVSAIGVGRKKASFSNYGASVDVAAPGVDIRSCRPGGGYVTFDGTSMAAPHVAAVAAMVKLQNPGFSPARVERYIKTHCTDLGEAGWDKFYGYGMPVFGKAAEQVSGDYTYTYDQDGAMITAYGGSASALTIPDALDGHKVVRIGEGAFAKNGALARVTVPGTVEMVGARAFEGCAGLTAVTLEKGVKNVGEYAFAECAALTRVDLPEGLRVIGASAFYRCAKLGSIALPDGINSIGAYAFASTAIEEMMIPKSVGLVEDCLLQECAKLRRVTIEEGVDSIGAYAFYHCPALTDVTVPESVRTIGYGAFSICAALTQVELPGVREVGKYAFYECAALEGVTLPRGDTAFDETIFEDSPGATLRGYLGSKSHERALKLGVPFETIGVEAPMTGLKAPEALAMAVEEVVPLDELLTVAPKDATLPWLMWESSDPAVAYCESIIWGDSPLQTLVGKQVGETTLTGTAQDGSALSVTIKVTVGPLAVREIRLTPVELALAVGESATVTAAVLPEEAPERAIAWTSENESIATVDDQGAVLAVAAGDTRIIVKALDGSGTEASCAVRVAAAQEAPGEFTVKTLGDGTGAITGYTGTVEELIIPARIGETKITTIAKGAFAKTKITSLSVPEGVTAIEERAFAGCASLKEVSLPDNLISLAGDAFKGCKKLPKVKSVSFKLTDAADGGIFMTPVFTPGHTASAYTLSASPKKGAQLFDYGYIRLNTEDRVVVTLKAGGRKAVLAFEHGEPYAATKLTIKGKKARTVKMGKELELSWTVTPASAQVIATWESANPAVATVAQDGTVTPVAPGKTKITLKTDAGLSASVTVTVKQK